MLLYIYINSKKIDNSIELNFDYIRKYTFNNNTLTINENQEYSDVFFEKNPKLRFIHAIIGENGAGKSTSLKFIIELFKRDVIEDEFIVVKEEAGYLAVISNMNDVNIENLQKQKLKGIYKHKFCKYNKYSKEKIIDELGIYYSNILDYKIDYSKEETLIDISTNAYNSRVIDDKDELDEDSFITDEWRKVIEYVIVNKKNNVTFPINHIAFDFSIRKEKLSVSSKNEEFLNLLLVDSEGLDKIVGGILYISILYMTEVKKLSIDELLNRFRENSSEKELDNAVVEFLNTMSFIHEVNITEEESDGFSSKIESNESIDELKNLLNELESDESSNIDDKTVILCFNEILEQIIDNRRIIPSDITKQFDISNENTVSVSNTLSTELSQLINQFEDLEYEPGDIYSRTQIIEQFIEWVIADDMSTQVINEETFIQDDDIGKFVKTLRMFYDSIADRYDNSNSAIISKENYNLNDDGFNLKLESESEILYLSGILNHCAKLEECFEDTNYRILNYKLHQFSSGEKYYYEMFSRLHSVLKNINKESVLLLIDEGDVYMHPQKQNSFVKELIEFMDSYEMIEEYSIIMTSNSPFIISDLPSYMVSVIRKEHDCKFSNQRSDDIDLKIGKTFGANIHELLGESFMDKTIGAYAYQSIVNVSERLNSNDYISDNEYEHIKRYIDQIGERIIKIQMNDLYIKRKAENEKTDDIFLSKIEKLSEGMSSSEKNDLIIMLKSKQKKK